MANFLRDFSQGASVGRTLGGDLMSGVNRNRAQEAEQNALMQRLQMQQQFKQQEQQGELQRQTEAMSGLFQDDPEKQQKAQAMIQAGYNPQQIAQVFESEAQQKQQQEVGNYYLNQLSPEQREGLPLIEAKNIYTMTAAKKKAQRTAEAKAKAELAKENRKYGRDLSLAEKKAQINAKYRQPEEEGFGFFNKPDYQLAMQAWLEKGRQIGEPPPKKSAFITGSTKQKANMLKQLAGNTPPPQGPDLNEAEKLFSGIGANFPTRGQ